MTVEPWVPSEFESLEQNLITSERIPEGVSHLNRYSNILPNPRTRVRLSSDGTDESAYINANYIHSYDGQPRE